MGIRSSVATLTALATHPQSYWTAILSTGRAVSELHPQFDLRAGGFRPFDWSLDMVGTGDVHKITQITLHCPDGQHATLLIDEPGTAFQLKIASMTVLAAGKQIQAHLIGHVINKEEGTCFCYIWDRDRGLIQFQSSVYNFGSWRPGVLPLGALSQEVLGLRLS